MPYLSKRAYAELLEYRRLDLGGHILSTDGLEQLVAAYDGDPEQIGRFFMDLLAEWKRKAQN